MRVNAKKKGKAVKSGLFMYSVMATLLLCICALLYLRVRNKWIGEILLLGFDRSIDIILIIAAVIGGIHIIVEGSEEVLDSFAVGFLPIALYINCVTIYMYSWMRWIGIIYVIVTVAYVSIIYVLNRKKKYYDKKTAIYKTIWSGFRYLVIPSFLIVVTCLVMCSKKRAEIDDQKYSWMHDSDYVREASDAELKSLVMEDFRDDRFRKLSKNQREFLVETLVHNTMVYLTDDKLEPVVEHTSYLVNALADSDYKEMKIRILNSLYNPQSKEDVRELIGIIFHECYHLYEHYCVDTLVENQKASSALYYRRIKAWEANENDYQSGGQDFFAYQHQSLEADAEEFANGMADRFVEYIYE